MLAGIDEYIDGLTVLPPSLWDPTTRLEPPTKTLNQAKLQERLHRGPTKAGPDTFNIGDDHDDPTLQRTGRYDAAKSSVKGPPNRSLPLILLIADTLKVWNRYLILHFAGYLVA